MKILLRHFVLTALSKGFLMPSGQSAGLSLTRGLGAACLALTAALVASPCGLQGEHSTAATVAHGPNCTSSCCRVVPGLEFQGRGACASLAVDFKKVVATQAFAVKPPRQVAGPQRAYNTLHSRPGATRVIYLDFDGHTTGQPWSATPIIVTPYDVDSNPSAFNAQEQANITEIWQRVSECFSPWDVDVTTEAPSVADLIKSGGSDTKWGMRVLFGVATPSPAPGAGGVAFLYSFGGGNAAGEDVTCFVLQQGVGTGPKFNADAAIHEVGHTLGLSHDGRTSPVEGYYQGQGSGKVAWAPHMGVGYYVPLVQWSRGEYANADNTQDDLAIIPQVGGFTLRPDDFASTQGGAKAIPGAPGATTFAVNVSGVIETRNDSDWFKITAGSGALKLDAVGGPANTMLDIQLSLYDSKGVLVVAANPADDLIASINQSITAGTYFVKIDGVGLGSPLTTGYTDYSSLGQYTITGSFSTKGLKGAPVLATATDLFYGVKELPKAINPNIKVADPDNPTLLSATVKITNVVSNQDVLSLVTNPATMGNITSSYNSATGTLTLDSAGQTATLAQFQNALRAVSYSNTSVNPVSTPRKIDFQVFDGTITSNPLTSTVTIGFFYITVNYDSATKTLTIADDPAKPSDTSIAISTRAGRVEVQGAGATRIGTLQSSSQSVSFPFASDVKININFTGGNDVVSMTSVKSSRTAISLGDGNDSATITYCSFSNLIIDGGPGVDAANLVGTVTAAKTLTSVP